MKKIFYLFILLGACMSACKKEELENDEFADVEGTYFSITQFIKDQWDTYRGQPFGLKKIVRFNGKTDTTHISAMDVNWADVCDAFFASDISDRKYLGKYKFTMFDDATTMTRNFYYEALDNKLFTKKLNVSADYYTDKIKSIYIETESSDMANTQSHKLFYVPMKSISIQEYSGNVAGPDKELIIEYRFL